MPVIVAIFLDAKNTHSLNKIKFICNEIWNILFHLSDSNQNYLGEEKQALTYFLADCQRPLLVYF